MLHKFIAPSPVYHCMIIMRVIIRENRDGRATALLIQHLESQQVPHTPVRVHFLHRRGWLEHAAMVLCWASLLKLTYLSDWVTCLLSITKRFQ